MKKLFLPYWIKDIEAWVSLALITIISALTYLPLIGQLGYYWNDWYPIWIGRTQSLNNLVTWFSIDRPTLGYIYTRTYLLLGDNPLAWQIFAYFLRLAGIVGFFLLLRQIWPKLRMFTTTATILFTVYPGFLKGPGAVTFGNHLLAYALAIYSILFTVIAVRTNKRSVVIFATGLALLCEIGYPLIYEYMVGLEGLRLILIGYLIWNTKKSLKSKLAFSVLRWVPYLLPLAGFLFWRLLIFKSTRPTTDVSRLLGLYTTTTFAMTQKVVMETLRGFVRSVLLAWTVPFDQLISITRNRDLLAGLVLAILASSLFWFYFLWTKKKDPAITEERRNFRNIVGIGLVAVFCTLIPVTITNRSIVFSVGAVDDRYTLHMTIGIALIVTGGIFLLTKDRGRLWLPLGLLFLSIITHYTNLVYFRNAWEVQKQLWWQLAWRAPHFKDGTVLMVNLPDSVYAFSEDYEVWMPANIIYNNAPNTVQIYSQVLYPGLVFQVIQGAIENRSMRSVMFDRDYSHALIVSMPDTSSCVHVIDGEKLELSPEEPLIVNWVAPYSHIQQIETEGASPQPPEIIFGKEPLHTWCYYYQKMSLAQQRHDWDQVIALGEEAMSANLEPQDRVEWMPLIEGYAYSGELEKAENIIMKLYGIPYLREKLCMYSIKQREDPGLNLPGEGLDFLTDRLCNSQWRSASP